MNTPDEVLLQPNDYELPAHLSGSFKDFNDRNKQPVKVTRNQMVFFGERGVTWTEIEQFYGVDRTTLMRWYKRDYEKGVANTNIALRNRMVDIALNGDNKAATTLLIWLGKNRLKMSDLGATENNETGEDLQKKTTQELLDMVEVMTSRTRGRETGAIRTKGKSE